jgi:hypothetical protein
MGLNYNGYGGKWSGMAPVTDTDDCARLLVELVEKVGLLQRDLQHHGELDGYAARVARIEQKILALASHLDGSDPNLARAIRAAWRAPARSLAFRNAEHRKS